MMDHSLTPEQLDFYRGLCETFEEIEPIVTFYLALRVADQYPSLAAKLRDTDPFAELCRAVADEFASNPKHIPPPVKENQDDEA